VGRHGGHVVVVVARWCQYCLRVSDVGVTWRASLTVLVACTGGMGLIVSVFKLGQLSETALKRVYVRRGFMKLVCPERAAAAAL
jgi:hypothetical protein